MSFIRKIAGLFASVRLAIAILLLMLAAFTISVLTNNESSGSFFKTWWFFGLNLLLLINTVFCTAKQYTRLRRANRSKPVYGNTVREICTVSLNLTGTNNYKRQLNGFMRSIGYKTSDTGSDPGESVDLYYAKGRLGQWGSVVFHIGLILILLGSFYDFLFGFKGQFLMARDDWFQKDAYIKETRGKLTGRLHDFVFYMHNIDTVSEKTWAKATADISWYSSGDLVNRQRVDVTNTMRHNFWAVSKDNFGYMVNLSFAKNGQVVNRGFVVLNTKNSEYSEDYLRRIDVPKTPFVLNARFLPDWQGNPRVTSTKSYIPVNPALSFSITVNGKNPETVAEGVMRLGQEVDIGQGYKMKFVSYKPWLTLQVQDETGLFIIGLGSFVSLIGLILLYIFNPRFVCITFENSGTGLTRVVLRSSTKRFKHLFDLEITQLSRDLACILQEGRGLS